MEDLHFIRGNSVEHSTTSTPTAPAPRQNDSARDRRDQARARGARLPHPDQLDQVDGRSFARRHRRARDGRLRAGDRARRRAADREPERARPRVDLDFVPASRGGSRSKSRCRRPAVRRVPVGDDRPAEERGGRDGRACPSAARRAVVTGIGVVAPNGIGTEHGGRRAAGCNGVRRIERFDASRYATRFAGEVQGFDRRLHRAAADRADRPLDVDGPRRGADGARRRRAPTRRPRPVLDERDHRELVGR